MNSEANMHSHSTDAVDWLCREIQSVAGPAHAASRRLCRRSVPISPVDPSAWLCFQKNATRLFWSGKTERRKTAAIGSATTFVKGAETTHAFFERILSALPDHSDARAYGGFEFLPGSTSEAEWKSFGGSTFWIPRVELIRDDNGCRLACNFQAGGDEDIQEALAILQNLREVDAAWIPEPPAIQGRVNHPGREAWCETIHDALRRISCGEFEKIVLARRADYQFATPVDGAVLLHRIRNVTSNCFHFLFQPGGDAAFMGTTPERLFSRDQRTLVSEVLAGTRLRGKTPAEDLKFAVELLDSAKEQHEHDVVRRHIRDRLQPLCDVLHVEDRASLLRLERKQHLHSRVTGLLRLNRTDADLLDALHPTPAVGGHPSLSALRAIETMECFRRGWYAAPIGWISETGAEFAVAIRSGLVAGNHVSVYSGAGIVEGSIPDEEWKEIEAKISDFQTVAGPQ